MGTKTIDDVLLSRYIGELSANYSITRLQDRSPYQLPLRHTNILASHRGQRSRSSRSQKLNSGKSNSQRSKSSDSANGSRSERNKDERTEGDIADQYSVRSEDSKKLLAARKSMPSYLQIPYVYVVTAFKNGDRSMSVRVSATSYEKLLEQCTTKLGLPSAARRLFLQSGRELSRHSRVARGAEIYVSMGDNFKDPTTLLEKRLSTGADVQWTLNGINLPADRKRDVTRPASVPQRLKEVDEIKRRILIFQNGKGVNGIEVIANMTNIEELKHNCTLKFNCGQHIKRLLLSDGKEVESLERDVPEIDPLLNSSVGTPLLGPIWASKGENISPMGVEEYIRYVMRFVRQKQTISKMYKKQLELVYESDDQEYLAKDDKLKDKRILSMSREELEGEIEKEKEKQRRYSEFLEGHQLQLDEVEPAAMDELTQGSTYTMKHIKALPENSRLANIVPGIRVNAFMNGKDSDPIIVRFNIQEASRGLKGDHNRSKIVFNRFLDCLSASSLLESKNSKSKGILVRRVFTRTGSEIFDVKKIEQDQHIWVSHGEDWIDPFTYCMQAEISKAIECVRGDSVVAIIRSEIPQIDEKSTWRVRAEVPKGIEQVRLPDDPSSTVQGENEEDEYEEDKEHQVRAIAESEQKEPEDCVPPNSCFLQNSKNKKLCLFVEPVVGIQRAPKEPTNASDGDGQAKYVIPVWPRAGITQMWVVHKTGQISLKNFKLALSVSEDEIETNLLGAVIKGHIVQFSPLEEDEDQVQLAQKWCFSADGLIYSKKWPSLALTYLGGQIDEPQTRPKNNLGDFGYRNMLAACKLFKSCDDLNAQQSIQLEKYQHFGLRLSKFENFSTWRKAGEGGDGKERLEKHKDPSWSKLALLWPTDKKGNWIQDLDWPLECYMLAFAPPLKEYKAGTDSPKRFFCLKNGERNPQFGVYVTAPDMTNMKKQKRQQNKTGKKKKRGDEHQDSDSVISYDYLHVPHCSDMTVQQVEFKIFLELCTSLLGLTSAARRVFDENGKEYETLQDLKRDQILYVSVGDAWTDPKYTKEQLEGRSMLVKIAEDVDKIRSFIALKDTKGLVISTDSLEVGAKIGISRDELTKQERREKQLRDAQSPPDAVFETSEEEDDKIYPEMGLSAHDRACQRGDLRLNNLKWPWERIVSNGLDQVAEENMGQQTPTKTSAKKSPKALSLKQFVFDNDGFIYAKEREDLVLTATDSGGSRVLEVTLQKRKLDNVFQRWQKTAIGQISLKYQPASLLTVKLPKVAIFSSDSVNITSSVLTVQPVKPYQFGRAHQLFDIDEERFTIRCFVSNPLDISVTAANQSGCCTYYVAPKGEKLDQPGYTVYLPVGRKPDLKMKDCKVCVSCAKSLRGKYKLQKIAQGTHTDFTCAFGLSAELGLQERGSFQLLSDKIDLTQGEAEVSLRHWEMKIQSLRKKLSVKAISNQLSNASTPRPIRILAYRNGEGRLCKPVLIYGTSIQGIMDQCMSKLNISWAVRKLFLMDGTPVLDMEDLRRWCEAHAQQVQKRQKEIESGRLQPEMDEIRAEVAERTNSPQLQPSEAKGAAQNPKTQNKKDDLEPRLKERYFVIGSHFTEPMAYSLSISLFSLNFLEEILPQAQLLAGETQMVVRYSIFGQTISTDPFTNEDTFEGEKREIQIKSELPVLRRFFSEKFRLLKFDLVRFPEETVLATSYVPLDALIREEHEELINSAKIAADYAWYRKSAEKPKGERTHASVFVEVSITVSIDVDVKSNDDRGSSAGVSDGSASVEQRSIEKVILGASGTSTVRHSTAGDPSANEKNEKEALKRLDLQDLCIELWASTGEAFVPLPVAHNYFREMLQQRKELREIINTKDAEKHVLKMMQGRRLQSQEPGTFRSTTDPEHPVVVEGGWKTPKGEELMVEHEINELQDKEAKIRAKHAPKPPGKSLAALDFDRQLYKQSNMVRLRVFLNGEDQKTATTIWAENVHQVLENATQRLGLRKPAKLLFDLNGKDVHDFSMLSRDQLLCVSSGEVYKPPGAVFESVEIKANWGRAKRMYGPKSTNFQVQARGHPLVGVDPFGPPLHGGVMSQQLRPLPTFDTKRIRVFENGRAIGEPVSAFGDSLEALLKAASKQLKLHSPAVCFYNEEGQQIVNFSEISRDDLLFASTTTRGFIRSERR